MDGKKGRTKIKTHDSYILVEVDNKERDECENDETGD
jgi:hypothetical protein